MSDLTEVCLTVDTEFSIGGAFARPMKLRPIGEPHAYCPAEGKEHGLPFILRYLARFGFPATFFVETLSTAYFGDDPLRRIGDDILSAGQDLQLHLHPNWLHFRYPDWMERLSGGHPSGVCAGRSLPEMEALIATGLEPFERLNWPDADRLAGGSAGCRPNRVRCHVSCRPEARIQYRLWKPLSSERTGITAPGRPTLDRGRVGNPSPVLRTVSVPGLKAISPADNYGCGTPRNDFGAPRSPSQSYLAHHYYDPPA